MAVRKAQKNGAKTGCFWRCLSKKFVRISTLKMQRCAMHGAATHEHKIADLALVIATLLFSLLAL